MDGGAAANDWLMQFQADVLGMPVERPDMVETTALGAAGLAGLALGVWQSTRRSSAGRRFTRFEPRMDAGSRARAAGRMAASGDAALAWAAGPMTRLRLGAAHATGDIRRIAYIEARLPTEVTMKAGTSS